MKLTLKEMYVRENEEALEDNDYLSPEKAKEIANLYEEAAKDIKNLSEELFSMAGWVKMERSAPFFATSTAKMRNAFEHAMTRVKTAREVLDRPTTPEERGSKSSEDSAAVNKFLGK
jgi:hypothetical protein